MSLNSRLFSVYYGFLPFCFNKIALHPVILNKLNKPFSRYSTRPSNPPFLVKIIVFDGCFSQKDIQNLVLKRRTVYGLPKNDKFCFFVQKWRILISDRIAFLLICFSLFVAEKVLEDRKVYID